MTDTPNMIEQSDFVEDAPVFLGMSEVQRRVALSATTIYRRIEAGDFPSGILITDKRKVWLESEILAWQLGKIAEARR